MRKLIDADRLQEKTRTIVKDYARLLKDEGLQPARIMLTICGVIGLIQTASTVDAVEVVRCKDCKYWEDVEGVSLGKKTKFCTYHIRHKYARHDEDFCSRGVRNEGERHDG